MVLRDGEDRSIIVIVVIGSSVIIPAVLILVLGGTGGVVSVIVVLPLRTAGERQGESQHTGQCSAHPLFHGNPSFRYFAPDFFRQS